MNAFARIDKDAFFRFVASRPQERYEYVRGRIVQQMTGGTRNHGGIARRITRQLEDQVDGSRWWVLNDRGVDTSETVRYPDVVVEPHDEPGNSVTTKRCVLIVEVLSQSTAATDLDAKPGEYMSLATLDAYLVASQDEPAVLVWRRGADGRFAVDPIEYVGLDEKVELATAAGRIVLRLEEIYRGIL